jgi:hypothetical protein
MAIDPKQMSDPQLREWTKNSTAGGSLSDGGKKLRVELVLFQQRRAALDTGSIFAVEVPETMEARINALADIVQQKGMTQAASIGCIALLGQMLKEVRQLQRG